MALVAGISERWGVQLLPERKVRWVEHATSLSTPHGHVQNGHVSRAENVLNLCKGAPTMLPDESRG